MSQQNTDQAAEREADVAVARNLRDAGAKLLPVSCPLCAGDMYEAASVPQTGVVFSICIDCAFHGMEVYPTNVQLIDLTAQKDQLDSVMNPQRVHLGDEHHEAILRQINRSFRSKPDCKVFFLYWEGNKIPRGVKIDGNVIGYTQNGEVAFTNSDVFASYDRLVEFGGETRKEHAILVFI